MSEEISKDVLNEKVVNIEKTLERVERLFENYQKDKRNDIGKIYEKIDKKDENNIEEHKIIFVELGKIKTRVAIYAGIGAFVATVVVQAFKP